ncbi:MAG: Ig domain-containing protein [Ruminococcus sp.]
MNSGSATIEAGTTKSLTATILPTNSTNKTIIWSTSDASIATVSGGTVTGKKAGTVTITAKTTNGLTANAQIKVVSGHTFGTWTTTKNATCTQVGTKSRKCTVCGKTETQTIAKTGHKSVTDKAIPATCTTDGKTEGSHCSVCGAVIKAQDTIKATGHKFGNWTTTKSATCTESGTQIRKCETCGATESKSLSAKGHTEVVDKAIPATCTTDGKTEGSHCSVCGAVIKAQDTIKATGHKFGNWTTTKSATCTESGTQIRKCETCGATESKSLSAKGHTEVVDKAIPATCTTDGKTEGSHCSVCGAVIKAQTTITATGHKSSGWIVDKAASIGVKGSKHKECTVCKKVLETAEIPALSRISISKASVTLSTSTYAYDGKAKKPGITVKLSGKTLKNGTDYTVSYSNNTKVGTATVKITGKGNYTGSVSKTYSIKNNFKKATVSGISTKAFTGKNITQSITVKYNGKTLKKGTDYTVSYSNSKNIGTATVKITGKGSYTGTITKTFKINPAKQEIQKLTAKSKAFFVDWAQKGSATGYEIQYATNSKFTSAKKVTITNNKTDKTTISKLSGKKKYYVRVRSYTTVKGTKYYGAWSASKSVTTKK